MAKEIPLKLKYKNEKPKGKNASKASGNSGKSVKGVVPIGIRKKPKGKTRCP
jgi:hypothetical protein